VTQRARNRRLAVALGIAAAAIYAAYVLRLFSERMP
jgi:hypothetical protein